MRGNILATRRGELLKKIYDTVGADSFLARDVPVNAHRLAGMAQTGMLVRVSKDYPAGWRGHPVVTWVISKDALCLLRGEKIDRNQSRREMRK